MMEGLPAIRSTEYLDFIVKPPASGKKTVAVFVNSRRQGILLGTISWYSRWRQYVFAPAPTTLYNDACLVQIAAACRKLNGWQKRSAARRRDGD